jgi:hypothetical protein
VLRDLALGGERPPLSFPHGRWSPALAEAAAAAGFGPCFTSEPVLTPVAALAAGGAIGRVSVELTGFRRTGGLDLPGLAFSLLTRPHASRG